MKKYEATYTIKGISDTCKKTVYGNNWEEAEADFKKVSPFGSLVTIRRIFS